MKQIGKVLGMILLCLLLVAGAVSCGAGSDPKNLWDQATYKSDRSFGNGAVTVTLEVKAQDKSVLLTVKTDKEMLGEALTEHGLIQGENGAYGLYIHTVNGMTADNRTYYWSLMINGSYASTGVDSTPVTEGARYSLVYTEI